MLELKDKKLPLINMKMTNKKINEDERQFTEYKYV
jgi:hypothetical protein